MKKKERKKTPHTSCWNIASQYKTLKRNQPNPPSPPFPAKNIYLNICFFIYNVNIYSHLKTPSPEGKTAVGLEFCLCNTLAFIICPTCILQGQWTLTLRRRCCVVAFGTVLVLLCHGFCPVVRPERLGHSTAHLVPTLGPATSPDWQQWWEMSCGKWEVASTIKRQKELADNWGEAGLGSSWKRSSSPSLLIPGEIREKAERREKVFS